ncbi:helix-turn-helix domain-containing protein [Nissabacter archeti]|uniref:Helix-turn-helix domain-containing protein n=1 Tax=Nissabacter archeti TaxID=1917880 RepID=A0ABS5JBP2_9GAMM|nr:helix-turn-helix domain-containing protein [Nissabacter archeti]MBS0967376.1 helix-turn-helix domain-containing protein [Nissabacter archeti]
MSDYNKLTIKNLDVFIPPNEISHLRWKEYQILSLLFSRSPELVTRTEIIENIWKGTYCSDSTINQTIKSIRQKIGDDDHVLIKTIPRVGYKIDRKELFHFLNEDEALDFNTKPVTNKKESPAVQPAVISVTEKTAQKAAENGHETGLPVINEPVPVTETVPDVREAPQANTTGNAEPDVQQAHTASADAATDVKKGPFTRMRDLINFGASWRYLTLVALSLIIVGQLFYETTHTSGFDSNGKNVVLILRVNPSSIGLLVNRDASAPRSVHQPAHPGSVICMVNIPDQHSLTPVWLMDHVKKGCLVTQDSSALTVDPGTPL